MYLYPLGTLVVVLLYQESAGSTNCGNTQCPEGQICSQQTCIDGPILSEKRSTHSCAIKCGSKCCSGNEVCQDIPFGKGVVHNCIASPCTFYYCSHGQVCRVKYIDPSLPYAECYCPTVQCGINCCGRNQVCIQVTDKKKVVHNCVQSPCTSYKCPHGRCIVKYRNPATPYPECG